MYTLVIWTIVGFAFVPYNREERKDWRPISTYQTKESCERGAQQLGIKPDAFRCISDK